MKTIKTFESFKKTPHHIFWDIVEHTFDKDEMAKKAEEYAQLMFDQKEAIEIAVIAQEKNYPLIAQIFFDRADQLDK